MAATTNSKILLKKQLDTAGCCSICGKKLKFDRRSGKLLGMLEMYDRQQ
jgi:hypothetical protein